jgi:ATP-binding cassette subfamily F protein 3
MVLEELATVADAESVTRLRTILGAFLFSGDDVQKPVAVLSGGEKSRLALAKMLLHPANLLCLDEPTNHLDVTAREVLEEALDQFEGTMLFISHDRYFINRIATKVVEVRSGRLWEYDGDYDYFLEKREAEQAAEVAGRLEGGKAEREGGGQKAGGRKGEAAPEEKAAAPVLPRAETTPKTSAKEIRRSEAEARQRKSRAVAPIQARLKELETEIARLEERIRSLTDQMANPDLYRDGERAREVARERKALEGQVGSLYGKWEELAQRLESAMAGES